MEFLHNDVPDAVPSKFLCMPGLLNISNLLGHADNLVSVTYRLELSLFFDVFLLTLRLNTKYRNKMASYQLDGYLKTSQTHGRTNATSGKMSPPAGFQTSRPPRIAKI